VPTLSLGQYGTAGFPSTSCIDSTNSNFPFFENVSWVKGRHTITFGGEIERINLQHEVAFGPEGSFTFTGQFTQGFDGKNLIPNTGNVIADYLIGFPSAANAQALVTSTYRRGWYGALHVNDDFKLSPTLTLNLSLRYEIEPPLIKSTITSKSSTTRREPSALRGKTGVSRGLYPVDANDFGPRPAKYRRPKQLRDIL